MSKPVHPAVLAIKRALDEHVGCTDPAMLIRRADKKLVSSASFNIKYNRVINEIAGLKEYDIAKRYNDAAFKYAIGCKALQIVNGVCYRPGDPDVTADNLFNMWRAPVIEPLDVTPELFLSHMDYLIPDKRERDLVLGWLAWLIQRPTDKLAFALLITGPGGTGKSWLGYLLRVLLGRQNVTMLETDKRLGSVFNPWIENKQLVFVHEMAPHEKKDLTGLFAGIITEDTVTIERKGIDAIDVPNMANLICVTNYPERIKMLRTDRRWLIVNAADDPKGVNARGEPTPKHAAYYKALFEAIGTPEAPGPEARRVLAWLRTRDLTGFEGKSLAPLTATKEDVAAGGEHTVESQLADARREDRAPFKFGLFTLADAQEIAVTGFARDPDRVEAEVSAALQAIGCRPVYTKDPLTGERRRPQLRVRTGWRPQRLWATTAKLARRFESFTTDQLVEEYRDMRVMFGEAGDCEDIGAL